MTDYRLSTDKWFEFHNTVTREIVSVRRKHKVEEDRIQVIICPARFPNEAHICLDGKRLVRVRIKQDSKGFVIAKEDW